MTNCSLTLTADGRWQCPTCKWIYKRKSDKPPHRNCPKKRGQRTEDRGQKEPTPEQKAEAEKTIEDIEQQIAETKKAHAEREKHFGKCNRNDSETEYKLGRLEQKLQEAKQRLKTEQEQLAEAAKLIVRQLLHGPVPLDGPYPCDEAQQKEAIEVGKKLGWSAADAKKWAAALLRWRVAGYPKRTDKEVQYIVWICEACEDYKADEKRCRICRCGVSTSGMVIFNKARLKTENCSKAKW